MYDRATVGHQGQWQSGKPPVNTVVEVWFFTFITDAKFDGSVWRNAKTGTTMPGVEWWRPSHA